MTTNLKDKLITLESLGIVYSEEQDTREAADLALSTRIDNIVAPEGDPSLSEVADARVSGSTTYANLKARLDADKASIGEEVDEIKADLEDLDERVEALEEGGASGISKNAAILLCSILSEAVYGTDQSNNISTLYEMLAGEEIEVSYSITNNLTNAQNSNSATTILSEQPYSATISASSGYVLSSVTVLMGGVDITSNVYSNGTIAIQSVTGNILITALAEEEQVETPLYVLPNTPVTFDGSNYVDTGLALDGDYTLPSSRPFTIIVETTKGTTGGDQYLFAENATPTTKPFFYFCLNGSTKIYTYWFGTKSTTNISMASGNNVKIAFVKHEGESPTMYVKVNDNTPTVIQFPSTPSGAVVNSDDYLYIGCSPSQASSTRWKGTVSKFEVYARAFSTNEINTFLGVS